MKNLYFVVDDYNLNNTFSNMDMLKCTIPKTGVSGRCDHIDSVLLKGGRCLQLTTTPGKPDAL